MARLLRVYTALAESLSLVPRWVAHPGSVTLAPGGSDAYDALRNLYSRVQTSPHMHKDENNPGVGGGYLRGRLGEVGADMFSWAGGDSLCL